MIPEHVIEAVRLQNDIVEVISSYLPLKRAGGAFRALCPFHKEKTPSFNVHPQKQIYHCFGCGAGGSVIRFVMEYEHVDFLTAVRMLAERVGIRIESESAAAASAAPAKDALYKLHEEAALFYHQLLLRDPTAEAARVYLRERALDGQIAEEFLIGFALERWDGLQQWAARHKFPTALLVTAGLVVPRESREGAYDRFRNRLMFPIRDEAGRVIGFSGRVLQKSENTAKYVNTPESPIFHKGRILFALDKARRAIIDQRSAIVCEGQIDCIRCHAAGVHNVVASQGTALTEDHARLLRRYTDTLVLILDADKAGEDAALRAAEPTLAAGLSVSIATLPRGEDPDSLIRKQGAEAFQAVLERARSVIEFQLAVLREREDLGSEAGMLRASRAVIETIGKAPSAVLREQFIHQAALGLRIPEEALRADLRRAERRAPPPRQAEPTAEPAAAIVHPPDEVALLELAVAAPAVRPLIRKYLPREYLADRVCRELLERLLAHTGAPEECDLLALVPAEDEVGQRLAARTALSPVKLCGEDAQPDQAAQDIILKIWRKVLECRRGEVARRMEQAAGEERERLLLEYKQLTTDLSYLRSGWNKALPILEL